MTADSFTRLDRWLVLGSFATIYFIWGATYLAASVALRELPPFLLVALRTLPAGAMLLGLAAWRGETTGPSWPQAITAGTLLFAIGQGAMFSALRLVPTGASSVVVATIPLWVLGLEWAQSRGSEVSGRDALGIVTGLVGIIVLTTPWQMASADPLSIAGTALLLFCSASWAAGTVYVRRLGPTESPLSGAARQLIAGGGIALLVAIALGEPTGIGREAATSRVIAAVAFLSLLGSFLGFLAYTWLLARLSATRVASYAYVNPIVALLLGWSFGGEVLTGRLVAASALTIIGVAIVVTPARPRGRGRPAARYPSGRAGSPTAACPPGSPRPAGRVRRAAGP